MEKFAFECYADQDVFFFLRKACPHSLRPLHCYGQGEVVKETLVDCRAVIGMVDEDPNSTHHRLRDQGRLVESGAFVDVREAKGRLLLVVKPWLELSFVNSMRRTGLDSKLGTDARTIRSMLSLERGSKHGVFLLELAELRAESERKNLPSLPGELVSAVRSHLKRA